MTPHPIDIHVGAQEDSGVSETMSEVPRDDPLRVAWEKYKTTPAYDNTRKWAIHDDHVDGSLWAAFEAGYHSAKAKGEAA